ncbi:dinitrogenase iron-molybdenum cofactor biosynthesis protein [bacterium]|nr:dinitrogenase iron-molybdenum cofactor biosynthesis protein [bacterium]MBU1884334.1 dinitrogenase iron-molybdenum cofactor biosynthesis protein [bacterium]
MNIAFASTTGEKIDQHFGWSKSFYMYKIDKEKIEFIEVVDSSLEPEGEQEKLNYKIQTLGDADIMYCTQIGPTASKMVQASGIHPARVAEGESIAEAAKKLQEMLNDNPPLWLLRIFHKAQSRSA